MSGECSWFWADLGSEKFFDTIFLRIVSLCIPVGFLYCVVDMHQSSYLSFITEITIVLCFDMTFSALKVF